MRRTVAALALLGIAGGACSAGVDEPERVATPESSPSGSSPSGSSPSESSPATPVAPTTPTPTPTPTPVLGTFDQELALRFAVDLAALGPRDAGTPGDPVAQDLIATALEDAGWIVLREAVALPQGGTTNNLVAVRDRADLEQRHVVVGGHHDTRGNSPGANDNASGIGVLVALAREWRDEPAPVPVVLVAFGAEEYQPSEPRRHHLGSAAYVEQRGDRVVAAAIIDMVGNGDRHCICWYGAGPRTMADRYLAAATEVGLEDRVAVEERGDVSDHGPFALAGIPAAFLWSYPDGRLHTPDDTAEHLDGDDLGRAGSIALAFLRSLAQPDDEALRAAP